MSSKWPPRWRHQICVEIRWRQRDCGENYCIDCFDIYNLPTYVVLNLIRLLIYPSLVAAISIVHGDRDGGNKDERDAVCQSAYPGGY